MNIGTLHTTLGLLLVCGGCASTGHEDKDLGVSDRSRRAEVAFQFLQDPRRVAPRVADDQFFVVPVPLETPLPQYPQGGHVETSAPVSVAVRIVVGDEGAVREVLDSPLAGPSSPDTDASFRAAVEDAVRRWTFLPAAIRTLGPGEDLDHDSKPDYTKVVDSKWVPCYLDVRFRFEMLEGTGRVRFDTLPDVRP